MLKRFLCSIGLHLWIYTPTCRSCARKDCNKEQKKIQGLFLEEEYVDL